MALDSEPSRQNLPIPDAHQPYPGLVTYDAKDPATSFAPTPQLRPPAGAPNVLVVLLDDIGFAASSAFGGPCDTPVAERLAAGGLKYTRFHTTALCAPTRQALLTGRNHHSVGMGCITELATSAPGYNGIRPNTAAPLAEVLKLNGYSTSQFGKCHEVPVHQSSPMGPFDAWPTGGGGFEYFYGFIGGETNQYYPAVYEGTTPVEPPATPEQGYHFTEDMTNKAISWVSQQKALVSDKPFFMYFAPGATHAPHHVPKDWIDRYRGRFDSGWDVLREEIVARQKTLGVIPADAELTARPAEIPAWDDMPAELKPVLVRQMEVYAAFLAHTDFHVGRLIDTLDDLNVLDDTLVYYIIGDNGASAEGTVNGSFNETFIFNGAAFLETPEFMASKIDEFGGPEAYNHYAVGWAHAMDTPYQWTKQVASHWGGTRNGTIVHWPNGFAARGELRAQFCHVIDIAPTVLEAAGLPAPKFVHGVQQMPHQGTSMNYSFDDASAAERHDLQYFEMFVNRGVYHQGWTAVTRHSTPWVMEDLLAIDDDVWELYGPDDWTQARNIASENPGKLSELQRLFLIEATKYNVLPLDDRRVERFNADLAGRPQLIQDKTQLLYGGMGRLSENSVLVTKNKSHAITANVTVPDGGAEGVIVAQGGAFAGWCIYAKNGTPKYCYNLLGLRRFIIEGDRAVPPGDHQVRVEFDYDGGGLAKGAAITLFLDGDKVGDGRLDATVPMVFSGDETTDVGRDAGTGVSDEYSTGDNEFTGTVHWVQIDIDENAEDLDHLITPEERWQIAMARQ
jgi:arylsulfatase A-like enzyme